MFKGIKLVLCFGSILMNAACSTVSLESQKPDTGSIIFNKPIKTVHNSAENAFLVNGLKITRSTPNYIQGIKPSARFSLFVVHGGENFSMWLESIEASKTRVHAKTFKNMKGGLAGKAWGQKQWERPVLEEMERSLK